MLEETQFGRGGGKLQCAAGFGTQLAWERTRNRFRSRVSHVGTTNARSKLFCEAPDRNDEDLDIIEQLLGLALEAINRKAPDVRLADILKLLEFKHRLKPQADARAIFWEWIERFRQDAAPAHKEENT